MKRVELKVARIGNSRGVRIPATTLERYGIGDSVVMEEREEGILLRPRSAATTRLSWAETALAMAAESEDWAAWDSVVGDAMESVPWTENERRRVAEPSPEYRKRRRGK